jgi:peptidoglycan/xylan/chitin deacetylase (PgdA/CDA1 family)
VGDHTYRHSLLPSLSTAKARSEIRNGASAIDDLGGTRATLFRPPYGKTTDVVDRLVEAEGMRTVLWSLSLERYVDHQSVATGVARLVGRVRPGAIILAHDGGRSNRSRTLLALPLLIRSLQQRGYRFVTVSQLLGRGIPEDGRS